MSGAVPALHFDPEVLLAAQGPGGVGLRVAIFDVDGVLTNGQLYFTEAGETIKAFSTLDGYGLRQIAAVGIEPVVVTGRDSAPLRRRLGDLGITHVVFGVHDKLAATEALLADLHLGWEQAAAMGDDWPDLPVLDRAAFSVAPPHAHPEVHAIVHHVTRAAAGQGAAREFCDLLLMAQGGYVRALEKALQREVP